MILGCRPTLERDADLLQQLYTAVSLVAVLVERGARCRRRHARALLVPRLGLPPPARHAGRAGRRDGHAADDDPRLRPPARRARRRAQGRESGRRPLVPPRCDAAGPAPRRPGLAGGACRLRAARAEPGAARRGVPRLGRGAPAGAQARAGPTGKPDGRAARVVAGRRGPVYRCPCGAPGARRCTRNARRRARCRSAGRGARGRRHRRARDRQDLARDRFLRISTPMHGCSSAAATISRSRARSGRCATWPATCRRRSIRRSPEATPRTRSTGS